MWVMKGHEVGEGPPYFHCSLLCTHWLYHMNVEHITLYGILMSTTQLQSFMLVSFIFVAYRLTR